MKVLIHYFSIAGCSGRENSDVFEIVSLALTMVLWAGETVADGSCVTSFLFVAGGTVTVAAVLQESWSHQRIVLERCNYPICCHGLCGFG